MRSLLVQLRRPFVSSKGDAPVFLKAGILFLFVISSLSCDRLDSRRQLPAEQKAVWEEMITAGLTTDSLHHLLRQEESAGNQVAITLLFKALGTRMRESSRFSEAITYHEQGLLAAYAINDTIAIVEALNNLGTDFRRVGALPDASVYHYRALQVAEAYSGRNDSTGRKNRVMAINGIGNIDLSFGNYDEAERSFREALTEEKALNSALGQAMNFANIGVIYQERQMYDSAFAYYQRSMEQNILAGSQLGIGLCHIHMGQIYELQNDYFRAAQSYWQAYDVIGDISDTWHWLKACLSLGRIRLLQNDFAESEKYISLAKETAIEIRSPQRLSEVYDLLHDYNLRLGNYAEALNDYKLSRAYLDSVQNMQKLNRVTDMRINYERDKSRQQINRLNIRNEMEARQKKIILASSIVFVLLLFLLSGTLFYAYTNRTRSNRALRNLNRIRTNFFNNITHEFRTPLTVILGLSERMQSADNLTHAESDNYLDAIHRQGTHLLGLVNQLLNMAKVNAGIDNPEWIRGNIAAYIGMVVESFRLYARDKDIMLTYSCSETEINIDFVPGYIDDIMRNLLSNAIKFSGPGSEINVAVMKNKKRDVELKVADKGSGIPEEELAHIFDLFYQGNQSEKNNGSGIGLNYTRQLVEIMNGTIAVESEVNIGTQFTITLPAGQSETLSGPLLQNGNGELKNNISNNHSKPVLAEGESSSATILLVEDNADVALYIKSLLPSRYKLVVAHDGHEGLQVADELVPDLIISDIMMPGTDGVVLCAAIRRSELLNHIPFILLTAKSTLDDQLQGLKGGADAYIRKPFHPDELRVRIDTLLQSRRLLKEKYMRSILKGDNQHKRDINMEFLQKATDIVYHEMHNPDFSSVTLAEKLCLSPSQLNRKLTAVSGFTPSIYILNLRIERAKKKLLTEDKSISQIAEECGFNDIAYFSRIFKRETRATPSQFRRLPR